MCLLWFYFIWLFVYAVLFFCFFFFSSRRRHTRCLSDWSSDVCSSDLNCDRRGTYLLGSNRPECGKSGRLSADFLRPNSDRSEERRVGKECRSRWSTYD